MSQDGRDIFFLYVDCGYFFFQVILIEIGVIDYYINYEMWFIEGKEVWICNIIIKGNMKINEYVICWEICIKLGDLFN